MLGRVNPVPATPPRVGTLVGSSNDLTGGRAGSDTETNADGNTIRWPLGFSYEAGACGGGTLLEIDCADQASSADEDCETLEFRPYMLDMADRQTTFGHGDDRLRAEREARVRELLDACESKLIETELWKGTWTQAAHVSDDRNRYLASVAATLPEGRALLGYATALAVLERAIGSCMCGAGMIHARPDTVTLWAQNGLIERQGDLLVTKLGTIVVAGRGYDGSGPPGEGVGPPSADSAWAYGTGITQLRRSTVEVLPVAVAQATNRMYVAASRAAAVTWDCCHIGVRVDHDVALSTTGS